MPTPPDPTTPDERVVALEVEVATLREELAGMGRAVQRLLGEQPAPVVSWFDITDPDTAADVLHGLAAWVDTVWSQWPDGKLPTCWPRHGDVVDELYALQQAWTAHTRRGGRPDARVDWLLRHRSAAAKRFAEVRSRHLQPDAACVTAHERTTAAVIAQAVASRFASDSEPPATA
jgi:hypothetical protein